MQHVANGKLRLEGEHELDISAQAVDFTSCMLFDPPAEFPIDIYVSAQQRLVALSRTLIDFNRIGAQIVARTEGTEVVRNYLLSESHTARLLNCLALMAEDHPDRQLSGSASDMLEQYESSRPQLVRV